MADINNPQAFPRPASKGNNYLTGETDVVVDPQRGMTLLDYFAAAALPAYAANDPDNIVAKLAYDLAEAMLQERARRKL